MDHCDDESPSCCRSSPPHFMWTANDLCSCNRVKFCPFQKINCSYANTDWAIFLIEVKVNRVNRRNWTSAGMQTVYANGLSPTELYPFIPAVVIHNHVSAWQTRFVQIAYFLRPRLERNTRFLFIRIWINRLSKLLMCQSSLRASYSSRVQSCPHYN